MHDAASQCLNIITCTMKQVWAASRFLWWDLVLKFSHSGGCGVGRMQMQRVWSVLSLQQWDMRGLISAGSQHRARSQPHANATQMYSSAPFCVPQLYVLKSRYGTCFEQQYPLTSLQLPRTVICVYRMTPERSLWEQWYVTDVLLIVLISNWTPLGWSKTLWLI